MKNFVPKQPFMVELSKRYYKYVINNFGISHFYSFYPQNTDEINISVPDDCIDLMIYFNEDKSVIGADYYGMDIFPHSMKIVRNCEYFGVRFMPGVLPFFSEVNMNDLIDKIIPFVDISPRYKELVEKIVDANDFYGRIKVFLGFYLDKYCEKDTSANRILRYVIKMITDNVTDGQKFSCADLVDETGYSMSYINKVFEREIGISPKKFSDIYRFQFILNNLPIKRGGVLDFDKIIFKCNYYDQAHFIHDFKKYTSFSPQEYVNNLLKSNYDTKLVVLSNKGSLV